jgi:hypothetical protein
MNFSKTSLVITSIAAPNAAMKMFADACVKHEIEFIVIGDVKSPADFILNGCRFYSLAEQEKLDFQLARLLPKKHYSRKNLGYLLAAKNDCIIETDDDNFPKDSFWEMRVRSQEAEVTDTKGWTNVYSRFSDEKIWPRGFPLEQLPETESIRNYPVVKSDFPIQQGLADENPDVDAVYRMTRKLPVTFRQRKPLAPGNFSWCPFNSQNTTWFREAFPLMYLPSFCSFRMTDIWRSFVAQRIAWSCGWQVLFHQATVWQERNEHSLLKDFEDEVPGYLNNFNMCGLLENLALPGGTGNMHGNLIRCYELLIENKFIGREEMPLLEAWLNDIGNTTNPAR